MTGHTQSLLEYGWPDTLVSDNGQCYNATYFRQVIEEIVNNQVTSLSHFHQSNGLAKIFLVWEKVSLQNQRNR